MYIIKKILGVIIYLVKIKLLSYCIFDQNKYTRCKKPKLCIIILHIFH